MAKPYGPFTAVVGTIDLVTIDQFPDTANIVVMNLSPYTLKCNPGTGSYYVIAPGVQDKIPLNGQFSGKLFFTGASDVTFTGAPPSVTFYVMGYREGESIPGVYPSALPGGIVQVSGPVATQVVNSGNAAPAAVVLGTPLNKATELEINNDGSGFVAGGKIAWDNTGKESYLVNTDVVANPTLIEIDDNAATPHVWQIQTFAGSQRPIAFVDATLNLTALQLNTNVPFGMGSVTKVFFDSAQAQTDGNGNFKAVSYITIAGKQENGRCGNSYSNVAAGVGIGPVVNYKTQMTNIPTSIATSVNASSNMPGVNISRIDKQGFQVFWVPGSSGTSSLDATYTTAGN